MAMVESTLPPSVLQRIELGQDGGTHGKPLEAKSYPKIASRKVAIQNDESLIIVDVVVGLLCSGDYTYSPSYSSANK